MQALVRRKLVPVTKLAQKTLRFNKNQIETALSKLTLGEIK
ncbi:MAG: hypothetical protein C5B47_00180 [Verrucomicrobia bacterium]|nr:MAG: hypothetical protein C5B47_00180 [Verrucomicrobiota bacterium]